MGNIYPAAGFFELPWQRDTIENISFKKFEEILQAGPDLTLDVKSPYQLYRRI
eukprot:m.27546 g.27546  ORF g.27546 m.27546 type:complete len:53 (+) comp30144_c0_seq2:444-602(+)